ncbi:hypothetical protein [Vulcanisaeta distributa]|uniref:hypothetical protein n=1 Tax=Vulcanisaeta distributa TaxID=164451 RepID=UPI001FB54FE2|nr:hypothetical protein [Vulcanisaeta distributa]
MLRQCLDKTSTNANVSPSIAKTESIRDSIREQYRESIGEYSMSFEDNPCIQITRPESAMVSNENREGH